jgi:cell division protein FtsI (penicillin-binding protein 3)
MGGFGVEMLDDSSNRRLRLLSGIILCWAAVLLGRLVHIQIFSHEELRREAGKQQSRIVKIPPVRGPILDRNGQPLAISLPVDSICVNPLRVPDAEVAGQILGRTLNLDPKQIETRIRMAAAANNGFLWIKRKVAPEESRSLRSLKLSWVEFRTEVKRFYPLGTLGSHPVGYIAMNSQDREYEHGAGGVELMLDNVLFGEPGEMQMFTDVRQNAYDTRVVRKPVEGSAVTLSIDARIQHVAERALEESLQQHRAEGGAAVVVRPSTGEILALASAPLYDPNLPPLPETMINRFNWAVNAVYEPGSIFKVFTFAAAFETTRLREGSRVPTNHGVLRVGSRTIRDDHTGPADMSMADVLAKSSNVGATWVALQVKEKPFQEYIRRFGFGRRTGIALPGERPGVVYQNWRRDSIYSVAMGYELDVNTIQLAMACSAIANGGVVPKPQLILEDGRARPLVGHRAIKPETAVLLRRLMEEVVLRGTGKRARLDGYTSAGKTGTAKQIDPKTGKHISIYNASFIGFAPVSNPAIVIAVTLFGTKTGKQGYGGTAAAPVFKQIAEAALRILEVPRDRDGDTPEIADDLSITESLPAAESMVAINTIGRTTAELDRDESQSALDNPSEPGSSAAAEQWPRVPKFAGLTRRAVIEQSVALGIPVVLAGRGVAREQVPAPGSPLPPGERVRVQFGQ